jgi:uncharacterized protein GlcG (DUF336 family)
MRNVYIASVRRVRTSFSRRPPHALLAVAIAAVSAAAQAQENIRTAAPLTLALSIEMANEAIRACGARGYRVAASVVDPDGVIKVQARGDDSPIHSLRFSYRKAYTVVSMGPMFGVDTASGVINFLHTKNPAGLNHAGGGSTDLLFLPGAALIKSGDKTIGSIGVSGAPLSSEDETCAVAAVAKLQTALDARKQ